MKTTYEVDRTLQPIYSGGSLALSEDGRILAASLGEDVLLSDLTTGKELARIEGDGETITALACEYQFICLDRSVSLIVDSDSLCISSDHMFTIPFYEHICS